ncbi:2-hydroxychromene-2-carboxylate isomerase [Denitromonas sp.]|uniref:2-hydroxychromene-2-carboxylate isomerase n=1 Tax=Denitromonas sp. TaxID=2734609 RepID=UPI003A869843
MAEPIDFYFDFSSPYGYFMSEKIDGIAAGFGRKVRWHPILLGVVYTVSEGRPLTDVPLKGDYAVRDIERSARYHGVRYAKPDPFPIPTQAAARAYYWLHDQDCALARRFAHAAYRAYFQAGRNIGVPEVVVEVAAGLGVDGAALAAALQSDPVKARLKAACSEAIDKGVFGSPFVIIDGEPFWGADRLPQIERWLDTGGF